MSGLPKVAAAWADAAIPATLPAAPAARMLRLDNSVISVLLLFALHSQNRPANADQTRSSPKQNEIPLDREDQPERRRLLAHAVSCRKKCGHGTTKEAQI
jgi:hypothetical protein